MELNFDALADHLGPSLDLLKHYKDRIAGFAAERETYIARLADVEAQNAELHRLRWELKARDEEVRTIAAAFARAGGSAVKHFHGASAESRSAGPRAPGRRRGCQAVSVR